VKTLQAGGRRRDAGSGRQDAGSGRQDAGTVLSICGTIYKILFMSLRSDDGFGQRLDFCTSAFKEFI